MYRVAIKLGGFAGDYAKFPETFIFRGVAFKFFYDVPSYNAIVGFLTIVYLFSTSQGAPAVAQWKRGPLAGWEFVF